MNSTVKDAPLVPDNVSALTQRRSAFHGRVCSLQFVFDDAQRQPGARRSHRQLLQDVGDRTDVILVTVRVSTMP